MATSDFYLALENRFRGSHDLIRARLQVYAPLFDYLKAISDGDIRALDVGSGRGEWLELVREHGARGEGIDHDRAMVDASRELGLHVRQGDAISALQETPNDSLHLITAFHIIEHLELSQQLSLICEALRSLAPGGILVIETPNPENPVVGSCNFYIDPTHRHPIPPMLLSFMVEHLGFGSSTVLRLQHSGKLEAITEPSLGDVFFGASPDYAVVAQKVAAENNLPPLGDYLQGQPGLTLEGLASRYSEAMENRLSTLEKDVERAAENRIPEDLITHLRSAQESLTASAVEITRADADRRHAEQAREREEVRHARTRRSLAVTRQDLEKLQTEFDELTAVRESLENEIVELRGHSHHWWLAAQAAESDRDLLLESWSWRITRPLRAFARGLLWLPRALAGFCWWLLSPLRSVSSAFLEGAIRWTLDRPALTVRLQEMLTRLPWLHEKLVRFAQHRQLIAAPRSSQSISGAHDDGDTATPAMSRRRKRLLLQLRQARDAAPAQS